MKITDKKVAKSLNITFKHLLRLCKALKFDVPEYFTYQDLENLSKLLSKKKTYKVICILSKVDKLKESLKCQIQ